MNSILQGPGSDDVVLDVEDEVRPRRPQCRGPDVEDLARLEDVVREVTIRDVVTSASTLAAESADK